MKYSKIEIKKRLLDSSGNSFLDVLKIVVFVVLLLILLIPILVIFLVYGLFTTAFSKSKSNTLQEVQKWTEIIHNSHLQLSYRRLLVEETPGMIFEHLDPYPACVYLSNHSIKELEGYFTNFQVLREDGVFIQKIILNNDGTEVISMPVLFFHFHNFDIETIDEFLNYENLHTKGNPDDFIIEAEGTAGLKELRITKKGS